jgi:hypothetical protein
MKGVRFLSILTAAAILATSFWPVGPAVMAHTIGVDGDPSDWVLAAPTNVTTGHVGRNASYQGEYIWADSPADTRTDGTDPDSNYELTEFRVSGDADNLYFLIRLADITDDGLPYVAITVDTDRESGVGNNWYPDFADTSLNVDASWERAIVVNLNKTGYYDTGWTWHNAGSSFISDGNDAIEIGMPCTDLGISYPAAVRFTVIVGQHDGSGGIVNVGDASISNALDAVTNYGDPGSTSNTWAEVGDGQVDYYFDVYFDPNGEAISPLLIGEVIYDPSTGGTDTNWEWAQIYNIWPDSIPLANWKIGDEEVVNSTEGMYILPSGTIDSASFRVAAYSAATFDTLGYGCTADFDLSGLSRYTAWSSGTWGLGNSGDEVLLLDPCDTVMDVVTWNSSGTYPGVTNAPDVAAGSSLERYLINRDSNDCNSDFRAVAGDGTPCDIPTAISLASFSATAESSAVVLRWETTSEVDNLGFNLYRAGTAGGPRALINDGLILAQAPGSPTGASYTFQDAMVLAGRTYYYWLEDLDLAGTATLHGPVTAAVPARQRLPLRPRLLPARPGQGQ